MAKLFFNYSTMNAGKSTILLQAAHNYEERGMIPYLLTAEIDKRFGEGKIASRIGIEKQRLILLIRQTELIQLSLNQNKKDDSYFYVF